MLIKAFNFLKDLFVLTVIFFSMTAVAYGGKDASIYDLAVLNSDENLLLYFRVQYAFNEEMEQGIASGIPVTFTFYVTLFEHPSNLSKNKIASFDFDHTLSFDTLKEEYTVRLDERDEWTVVVKDLTKAKELMVQVNDLKIALLENLSPQKQYSVRAKVRLGKKILPLNFHYIIPFWKFWEFNTEWAEIKFVR